MSTNQEIAKEIVSGPIQITIKTNPIDKINISKSEDLLAAMAFTYGIVKANSNTKDFFEHPILTVGSSLLSGSLSTMGALFVGSFLSDNGKVVYAGLIGASVLYHTIIKHL